MVEENESSVPRSRRFAPRRPPQRAPSARWGPRRPPQRAQSARWGPRSGAKPTLQTSGASCSLVWGRVSLIMLSRVAESMYWMSRYIERAENVARFIDVNLTLMLDLPSGFAQQRSEE